MSGKDIRDMVGLLAVVASLVFVGVEIRQNTAVARGQTRQALAELNQEWLVIMATDEAASDLMYRAWTAEAEISEDERRQASRMLTVVLRRLENVYLQFSEGLVDEAALDSYGLGGAGGRYRTDRFTEWWFDSRSGFHPGFVTFFEERFGLTT